ncbi:Response regulator receiver domain-containing protein [Humidesulfovibrio mexicanus]|uniref:Response regulator receiver domain-containing protein n=1 Tax=Humidesulfovibrio mexicanus TaxID=147047 RepID=A0A239A1X2_9BACT|nr:response regulator [Humidesulfovibrio mexicanus]SNR88903.1 Response regulator receiver domain-containing protein [Humidesulfovibrio mexicanus]
MAKILIAEDDPISQRFVSAILERMGHSAMVSPNGRHAWEALSAENSFALLITDIMMPGMDGTTLIRTLRADERFKDLPVIVMSAFIGVSEISGLLAVGATWFMPKPVERSVLEEYVKRALD